MTARISRGARLLMDGVNVPRVRTFSIDMRARADAVAVCVYSPEDHDAFIAKMTDDVPWRIVRGDDGLARGTRVRPVHLLPHDDVQLMVLELGRLDMSSLYTLQNFALVEARLGMRDGMS